MALYCEPNYLVKDVIEDGLTNYPNAKMYYKALWNKNGQKTLYIKPDLDSSLTHKSSEKIVVETITIDSFMKRENIQKLDVIKMDIEGSEKQALKGSVETLKKFKPKLLISVYHYPGDVLKIVSFLNSLNVGYKFWLGYHVPYSDIFANVLLYAKIEE